MMVNNQEFEMKGMLAHSFASLSNSNSLTAELLLRDLLLLLTEEG